MTDSGGNAYTMSMKGMEDGQVLSFNQQIIAEFRENQGRCGGRFEGNPMLLMTMPRRAAARCSRAHRHAGWPTVMQADRPPSTGRSTPLTQLLSPASSHAITSA